MALDTIDKRMSAILPLCTWRGGMVQVDLPFVQRHRQAAAYLYSGILAQSSAPAVSDRVPVQRLTVSSPLRIRGGL